MSIHSPVSKNVRLGPKGQVVIPAAMRKMLGWKPGDVVMLILDGNGVRVTTRAAIIKELSGTFAMPDGRSLGAELLEERRHEAASK